MSDIISISVPADKNTIRSLRAGDRVVLSGEVLVFRDEVHRILVGLIERGESLPFELDGAAVYYCGPTPARAGRPVGSAGPTTSSRMDRFTGPLLERGLTLTIGKGGRSKEVRGLLKDHGAAYLVATGGVGALLARHVTGSKILAYPGLGPEAARMFTFDSMPLIVGYDARGGSAFAEDHDNFPTL